MNFKARTMSAAIALATCAFASTAHADSLDYLGTPAAGTTSGWGATVQTFTSGVDQYLVNYAFLGAVSSQGSYKLSIYDWTGGTSSAALYSSTQAWIGGTNQISNINLALQAGHVYAAEVDYLGTTSGGVVYTDDVYSGGSGFWGGSGLAGNKSSYSNYSSLDTAFKADFSVTAVPEPSTYAMLLAGLGLLGVAARRRKQA